MTKLEHIQSYKGYAIMIFRIVEGRQEGIRYFKVGNREYRTIKEAKAEIDRTK